MQKSRPSLHKLLFVLLFCIKLFLFSNTIRTFLNNSFLGKPTQTRGQNTPWCKYITRSEQKSRQKTKAKRSSRKREHLLNDKSENQSVLGNEKWSMSPSKLTWCDPTIYFSKQNKRKLKAKTTDAPRKMHSAWSNKNIVCWKVTWCLPIKKGCLWGIPKLWCLYLLDISWGLHGHPQAWSFVHSSSHLIILQSLHLKTSFIQNFTQFY
jgi:hypothetical protein